MEQIAIHDDGVTETVDLGARGIYGNELATDSVWYASFNEDGARRCFKDLAQHHHIGWTCKDQIKVVVNLDKWRIKFYINGRKVLNIEYINVTPMTICNLYFQCKSHRISHCKYSINI